jgi:chromosome partitioning protein
VFAISSSKQLLQKRIPDTLPSPLANACRRVAAPVLDILRIEHEEVDIDAEDTMDEHARTQSRREVDAAIGAH